MIKLAFIIVPLLGMAAAEVQARTLRPATQASTEMVQLYQQVVALQDEVQNLRGQVEEQGYQIQQLLEQKGRHADTREPLNLSSAVSRPSAFSEEPNLYATAFENLTARNYDEALKLFDMVVKRYPSGNYAANAMYWIGEVHLLQNNSALAKIQFEEVIAQFPTHPKAADAMLKLGLLADREGRSRDAKQMLQDVASRFPQTASARLASARLAKMEG